MTTPPIVSVVVPVFNVREHLAACLTSIVNQTYPHLDIVVIDDGSTDGSRDIIDKFAANDERVRVISQSNSGVSVARNAGIEAASGDYVSFIDADDWIEPQTYELVTTELARRKHDFVTFGYFIDSEHESRLGQMLTSFDGDLDTRQGLEAALSTPNRFVFTRVFRREVIGTVRFRQDIHWGEDTIFVVEVARHARSSAVVHQPLYHYVQSEGSATRSAINPKRLTGLKMTEVLENLVKQDHPHLVDRVLTTRVNVLGILLHDARTASSATAVTQTRRLKRELLRTLPKVLKASNIAARTKLKAVLLLLNPTVFKSVRRVVRRNRGNHDN